jgi:hypothetical protein
MTPDELKSARERYGYIPARLVRVSDDGAAKLTWKSLTLDVDVPSNWATGDLIIRKRYSSLELDRFHRELLNSERDEELIVYIFSESLAKPDDIEVDPEQQDCSRGHTSQIRCGGCMEA